MKKLPIGICLALTTALSLVLLAGCASNTSSQRAEETPSGQDIVIPLADVNTDVRFYPATVDGIALEVLAVQAVDGTVRTAFNTCQVCFDSGRGYYVQEGEDLVCQNCKNRFPLESIGIEHGGCNPVPITDEMKAETAETVTIPYQQLVDHKSYFESWKR